MRFQKFPAGPPPRLLPQKMANLLAALEELRLNLALRCQKIYNGLDLCVFSIQLKARLAKFAVFARFAVIAEFSRMIAKTVKL